MNKIKRMCPTCNQSFKAMTDEQWKIVKYEHEKLSERHQDYLKLKNKEEKTGLE